MKLISALRAWAGNHKKLTAAIVALLFALVPDTVLSEDTKREAMAVLLTYILGQGIADHGKEAAKIEAAARSLPLK